MKKIILFTIGIMLFVIKHGSSQTIKNSGQFKYEFSAQSYRLVGDLYYNGEASIFVLHDRDMKRDNDTVRTQATDGSNHTMIAVDISDGQDLVWYKNYDTKVMVAREMLVNTKKEVAQDSIPVLSWVFTAEKKRIGTYNCQKATTTFHCAKYTAWFTITIPLSIGPWKLGGLPGLIVEATEESGNYSYKLISANYPSSSLNYPIAPPVAKGRLYSALEFNKIQLREINKMSVYLKSMSGNDPKAVVHMTMQECYAEK